MTAAKPDSQLEDIRREIDDIDDGLMALLARRFAASARVRATKKIEGSLTSSPLRPAREAQMLRRLLASRAGEFSPELLVRLWRVILSASTQAQAAVTIHLDADLAANIDLRVMIAEHFCGMAVEVHDHVASSLGSLERRTGDLTIVTLTSPWADWLSQSLGKGVSVIGTLPIVATGNAPKLLVLGHAEALPSGDDETIILSKNPPPSELAPNRWQARSGDWHVTSVAGFMMADETARAGTGSFVGGRCPTPPRLIHE